MKLQQNALCKIALIAIGIGLLSYQEAHAVPFVFNPEADLFLGFRKVGVFAENNEVVVNLGSVTNYLNVAAGNTITVSGYSPSQLTPDSFTSLNSLTWSAFAMVDVDYGTI